MKTYASLPKFELYFYCTLWVSGVLYTLFELHFACQQHLKLYDYDEIFDDGWPLLNRKKDNTDYEWTLWTELIKNLLPWFCLHLLGAELLRPHSTNCTLAWYILITSANIFYSSNLYVIVLIFMQVTLYFLLTWFKSRCVVWIFFSICTIFQNSIISFVVPNVNEDQLNIIFVSSSWLHLKCISFSLYYILSNNNSNILHIYGYCFYLPCFFLGPIILYEDFSHMLQARINFSQRSLKSVFNFFRFLFWYYFTEFSLHFIYIGVLPQQINFFTLSPWAMCGVGFAMGIFFYLKYIVVYGIAGSVVQFEGYTAPPPPQCIACIHLYSDMWRFFDCGLHKFIKNCIYLPLSEFLGAAVPKLFVSFACFLFIFLWHGLHLYVFIWSFLNFLGLVIELVGKNISCHHIYRNYQNKYISKTNQRRFHALLAAPLTIMSAISNFYFFGEGIEVGNKFIIFLTQASIPAKLILLTFMYTLSQVSIEYAEQRKRKKI